LEDSGAAASSQSSEQRTYFEQQFDVRMQLETVQQEAAVLHDKLAELSRANDQLTTENKKLQILAGRSAASTTAKSSSHKLDDDAVSSSSSSSSRSRIGCSSSRSAATSASTTAKSYSHKMDDDAVSSSSSSSSCCCCCCYCRASISQPSRSSCSSSSRIGCSSNRSAATSASTTPKSSSTPSIHKIDHGAVRDFLNVTGGLVAQRLGRWTYDQEVVSSTPGWVAIKWLLYGWV